MKLEIENFHNIYWPLFYRFIIRRFIRNTQIHRETKTPATKDFITTLTLNFHFKLPLATGALFYYIEQTSIDLLLKPRLSQDNYT